MHFFPNFIPNKLTGQVLFSEEIGQKVDKFTHKIWHEHDVVGDINGK